ncbi:MAG: hypothetical protein M3R61_07210, partial [Chloroflexota bacterium]|nr:hypothetical protein [Chloroflexota bacterium]
MADIDAQIDNLQVIRATLPPDAAMLIDDAIAKLRLRQVQEAADGGLIINSPQTIVQGDQHIYPPPPDHVQARQHRALIDYLRALQNDCSPLQLSRIDAAESRYQRPMRLEQVYIGAQTTAQVVVADANRANATGGKIAGLVTRTVQRVRGEDDELAKMRPLTALEAVAHGNPSRLMLLGAPGGGKSTFVNHLVLCLAGAALAAQGAPDPQPEAGWLARLGDWRLGALLPVRILLREFAAFPALAHADHGSLSLLLDFLRAALGAQTDAYELLRSALTDGQAILLFDGLDEVVGEPTLSRVVTSIADAAGIYVRCPIVVTCRVLDYQANPRRQMRGFAVETLAPLTDEQIDQFVDAWYAELAASGREALGNATALQQA